MPASQRPESLLTRGSHGIFFPFPRLKILRFHGAGRVDSFQKKFIVTQDGLLNEFTQEGIPMSSLRDVYAEKALCQIPRLLSSQDRNGFRRPMGA